MNKTLLSITALVVSVVTTIIAIGFLAPQSAAAQFSTNNSASQSSTQTATATGGAGGAGSVSPGPSGSANGGPGGSASITQSVCQQAAQSGAFGSSSNALKSC
jgi:hypothetical protein